MDLSSDVTMPYARQRLKVLERLETEPDLARALAEAINKSRPHKYCTSLRYKIADTVVDSALKIPGV